MSIDIVFLAIAYGEPYENLLCGYAGCVFESVDNAAVEMIVRNPEAFRKRFETPLFILEKAYPKKILIRTQSFPERVISNSVRFYEVPQIHAPYTYIGDVDIFITDPHLLSTHKAIMASTGLPYSNRVRGSGVKLTGLHCVRTDDYYTDELKAAQEKCRKSRPLSTMDEIVLFEMCKEVFGLTPNRNRPIHGVHVSFRRKFNEINTTSFKTFVSLIRESHLLRALASSCPITRDAFKRVGTEMSKAFDNGWHAGHKKSAKHDLEFLKAL